MGLDAAGGFPAEQGWLVHEAMKVAFEDTAAAGVGGGDGGVVVEIFVEKFPEGGIAPAGFDAEAGEALGLSADVVDGGGSRSFDGAGGGDDEVFDFAVDDAPDQVAAVTEGVKFFPEFALGEDAGVGPDDEFVEGVGIEEFGVESVVEVVAVVGDLVGEVGDLAFERGPAGAGAVGESLRIVVFTEAFEDFVGEIEAGVTGVFFGEGLDDTKRLDVVVEAAVFAHETVEGFLAGVAEGGVAEVVGEGDGFREVFVEAEGTSDGAGDGSDFDGVGQSRAVVVAGTVEEDLGLAVEAAEGGGVNDPGPIALEGGAVGVLALGVSPTKRVGGEDGVRREEDALVGFNLFAGFEHHFCLRSSTPRRRSARWRRMTTRRS